MQFDEHLRGAPFLFGFGFGDMNWLWIEIARVEFAAVVDRFDFDDVTSVRPEPFTFQLLKIRICRSGCTSIG